MAVKLAYQFKGILSMPTPTNTPSSLAPTELLKDELDQVTKLYNMAIDYLTNYSFQILAAFIIFIIVCNISHIIHIINISHWFR